MGWLQADDSFVVVGTIAPDDRKFAVKFEVSNWLAKAPVEEVVALAMEGWSHGAESDAVAVGMEDECTAIKDVIRYAEILTEHTGEAMGFGVVINKDKAMAWLEANRPEVAAAVVKALEE